MSDNDTKTFSEIFFKAEFRVGRGMSNGLGLDESTFDAFETIEDIVASETAMDAVAASATARDAIRNSATAFEAVDASNMAIGKFAAGGAGLDPSDFADMDAVAASETAMDAVAASETAMDAVAASETAMDAVVASEVAMDAVAASETAMDAAMGSILARTKLLASPHANSTVWESQTAVDAVWLTNDPITTAEPWTLDIDFSLVSDLHVHAQSNVGGRPVIIEIGSDEIYNDDDDNGTYKDESFDVSGYDTTETLTLTYDPDNLDERQLTSEIPSDYPQDAGLEALEFNESGEDREGRFYGLRFTEA